jgi:hypothetical protein
VRFEQTAARDAGGAGGGGVGRGRSTCLAAQAPRADDQHLCLGKQLLGLGSGPHETRVAGVQVCGCGCATRGGASHRTLRSGKHSVRVRVQGVPNTLGAAPDSPAFLTPRHDSTTPARGRAHLHQAVTQHFAGCWPACLPPPSHRVGKTRKPKTHNSAHDNQAGTHLWPRRELPHSQGTCLVAKRRRPEQQPIHVPGELGVKGSDGSPCACSHTQFNSIRSASTKH